MAAWSPEPPSIEAVTTRRAALIAAVGFAAFLLDRVSKALVVANVPLHDTREIIGNLLRITHTQNSGSAFGLFQERTMVLSVLSVVAVAAILYYYRTLAARSPLLAATLGMQLGGAFGNLVDRLGQGYVVDFIDAGLGGVRFWAFNLADSSIVVGIFLLSGLLWLEERRSPRPAGGGPLAAGE